MNKENYHCGHFCIPGDENCENDISCFRKIAGTLTGDEIAAHELVHSIDTSVPIVYQPTTVDLTVGDGHYVYDGQSSDTQRKWSLVFIGDLDRMEALNKKVHCPEQYSYPPSSRPRTLIIPAYGSAFVQLSEEIDTLTVAKKKKLMVVGRFDLKLSSVHQGLISQQATQIEPCYKGKLFCFIHNLSNKEAELDYGTKIATLEFSYASCFCNVKKKEQIIQELISKNSQKYRGAFCNSTGIDDIRYFYQQNKLPNDCGMLGLKTQFDAKLLDTENRLKREFLSPETIKKVGDAVDKQYSKKAIYIPLLVVLITAIVTLIGIFISTNDLKKKIEETDATMKVVESSYETLKNQFDEYVSRDTE